MSVLRPRPLLPASLRVDRIEPVARRSLRPLSAAVLLACGGGALAQAPAATPPATPSTAEPLTLRLERSLGAGRAPGTPPAEAPSFGRALKIEGNRDDRIVFDGLAELRSASSVLRADRITYTPLTDTVDAAGNVRLFRDGTLFTGPSLTWQVDAQAGRMPDAQFSYAPRQASGSAKLLEFLEPGRARLTDATYSACTPEDMAWWVRAEKLEIDNGEELAVARNGRLYFLDVPIFASPYFQFPLGDRRRSGILTPSFALNNRLGAEATVPLYWNIAPNRDATIAPRVMARRGVLLQSEFRYLEPTARGRLQYEILPNDRVGGERRSLVSTQHEWNNRSGLGAGFNINEVSDDRYFSDFGTNIVTASQSILPQEGFLTYTQPYFNTALRVTKNQTLQDPRAPVATPYERIPQLTFNALNTNWRGFDLNLAAEAVSFDHPDLRGTQLTEDRARRLRNGERYIVNPSIAYPLIAPGWFVIPKLQWHATRYELERNPFTPADNRRRELPIASLDAGLVFERDGRWLGQPVTQTLEPRLYYSYIPFREQNTLPNFDSALADFNFAQLFSENVFVGGDRIGEANQLTAALVSRMLDPETGAERLRAAIGQRYYNRSQRVALPDGSGARIAQSSDLLLALSGRLSRSWITDIAVQHATSTNQIVRATAGLRYQPRAASVLSLSYRYKVNELEQYDFAAQWPLARRWYGVARANYSTRDRRWIEALGGVEYKADCWVGRFAIQRFATSTAEATTQFLFAIELNGLGNVGTPVVEQLRRNIPGYQVINPPPVERGRFEDYE